MSLEKLQFLEKLYKKAQYPVQLLKQSAQVPYPVLIVGLSDEKSTEGQIVTFTYFPPEETEFESIDCLQIFTQLPFEITDFPSSEVWRYVSILNRKLPFGTFNYAEESHCFEFRHIVTAPLSEEINPDFYKELLELTHSLLDMFTPILSALYSQKISLSDALSQSALGIE